MRSKKGQLIFLGFMIGIVVFIIAVMFLPVIKDLASDVRSPSKLDCGNTTISTGTKMTCIVVDISPFYLFGAALAAAVGAIGLIGIKKLGGGT